MNQAVITLIWSKKNTFWKSDKTVKTVYFKSFNEGKIITFSRCLYLLQLLLRAPRCYKEEAELPYPPRGCWCLRRRPGRMWTALRWRPLQRNHPHCATEERYNHKTSDWRILSFNLRPIWRGLVSCVGWTDPMMYSMKGGYHLTLQGTRQQLESTTWSLGSHKLTVLALQITKQSVKLNFKREVLKRSTE